MLSQRARTAAPYAVSPTLWSSWNLLCTGEGATPRASRLSAEGRAGLLPNDNAIQMPDQAQDQARDQAQAQDQAVGAGDTVLSQSPSLGDHQDAHADAQGDYHHAMYKYMYDHAHMCICAVTVAWLLTYIVRASCSLIIGSKCVHC